MEIVGNNPGHLICSTACLGGYAAWCWKNQAGLFDDNSVDFLTGLQDRSQVKEYYQEKLSNHLAAMEQLFGKGNFYIELQPNEEPSDQNEYNKFMLDNYWGKYPFVFSTDSHYLDASQRKTHAEFLASKSSKDREPEKFYKYTYIMSTDSFEKVKGDIIENDGDGREIVFD